MFLYTEDTFAQLDEDIVPMPFDLNKELSHIKAHCQKRQGSNQKDKYVLYILDSSGSIGETNFKSMTNVTAQFSLFYCPGTKIAVMSYSSNVHRNYFFICDQTDTRTRYKAIKNIPYHSRLTASGGAIHCACNYMLNSPCGFPYATGQNTPELDVIFITDGHSNRGRDCALLQIAGAPSITSMYFQLALETVLTTENLTALKEVLLMEFINLI